VTSLRPHIGRIRRNHRDTALWFAARSGFRVPMPVSVASVAWRLFEVEAELRHGRFAMRHAWFLAICRCRLLGFILTGAMVFGGMGCHQHYYYYGDACAPGAPMPSSVRTGPVCDVPVQSVEGGAKLASGTTRSTVVSGGSPNNSSRVVVSEPSEPSRVSWRRSDPEGSLATTSVQGSTNDSSVNR
jgi:hypothetical protein